MNKAVVEIVPFTSQPIDTEELTRSLSQVSVKEKEITTLKEEKRDMDIANKEYQAKNTKLKNKLKGKPVLQSAQHSIWDLIPVEVTKFLGRIKKIGSQEGLYLFSPRKI